MPLKTIVEDYIYAALQSGEAETLDDGTVVATIPQFPGLVAYGADQHECVRELWHLLEETIRIWLMQGHPLPVLAGIDLTSMRGQVLASYHVPASTREQAGQFYEDENAFEAALAERRAPA